MSARGSRIALWMRRLPTDICRCKSYYCGGTEHLELLDCILTKTTGMVDLGVGVGDGCFYVAFFGYGQGVFLKSVIVSCVYCIVLFFFPLSIGFHLAFGTVLHCFCFFVFLCVFVPKGGSPVGAHAQTFQRLGNRTILVI